MINRTACFACTTPYQLLGAIAIVQNLDIEADLFILGLFANYKEIANKLKQYAIFKEVYAVDCDHFRNRSMFKTLWQYLNCKNEVARFLPSNITYDYLYSSSRQHIKLLLLHELKRRNPNLHCVIYEDGLGTYNSKSSVFNTSKNRQHIESLLGWNLYSPKTTSIMVTHPDLLNLPPELCTIEIKKMPNFNWSDYTREMLLNVFSVMEEDTIKERNIVFEVTRGVYKNELGMDLAIMDKCLLMIVNKLSYDNVVCKLHPRSRIKPNLKIKFYGNSSIPIEILYAGMEDLQDRILIGVFSTALFSPKMMFGKEPFVISLHRIVWPHKTTIEPVFEKLCNMYQQKERFFAPRSISELGDLLRSLESFDLIREK